MNKNAITIIKDILSLAIIMGIAVGIAFFIKNHIIINTNVPTGSMENTIMTDDCLIGNRLAYLKNDPERGDIIIFPAPDDPSVQYIKRIIGMPGETITIDHGKIYIDGSKDALPEPYLKEEWTDNNDDYTFEIPDNCYLALGDNRNNSNDARFWDDPYVIKDDILGKALFRYYPFNKMGKIE